jgi:hypothetical protein
LIGHKDSPSHSRNIECLGSQVEVDDRHVRQDDHNQRLHALLPSRSARPGDLANDPCPIPDPLPRLLRGEDTEFSRFLEIGRKCLLVRLGIPSAEEEDLLVGLDAQRFERNGDGDIVRERVVLERNKTLLHDDIRLRLEAGVGRPEQHARKSTTWFGGRLVGQSETTYEVTEADTVPLVASVSTRIRFLLSCSWTRMTFSVPRTTK